jgi:hypothetical protein
MTSVDAEIAARHEAAGVAEEKDGGTTVLLGSAEAAEHVLLGPSGLAVGVVDEQILQHLGQDVAGGEGVDTNAVLAPFGSQVASELDNSRLGRIVDTEFDAC